MSAFARTKRTYPTRQEHTGELILTGEHVPQQKLQQMPQLTRRALLSQHSPSQQHSRALGGIGPPSARNNRRCRSTASARWTGGQPPVRSLGEVPLPRRGKSPSRAGTAREVLYPTSLGQRPIWPGKATGLLVSSNPPGTATVRQGAYEHRQSLRRRAVYAAQRLRLGVRGDCERLEQKDFV